MASDPYCQRTIDACIKLVEAMPDKKDGLPPTPAEAYEQALEDVLFQLLGWRGRVTMTAIKEQS